jgi:RHS repeat-associated protein
MILQFKKYGTAAVLFFLLVISVSSLQAQTILPTTATVPAAQQVLNTPAAYNAGAKINYVRTWEPRKPISDATTVPAQTMTDVKQATAYVDGQGRIIQTVIKQISPLQKDMVSTKVFDDYGKETLQYLPYVSSGNDGYFKTNPFAEQQSYFSTAALNNNQYAGEQVYYGRTAVESSPLNRPDTVMAPGNAWAGSNRGVITKYLFNDSLADAVRIWTVTDAAGTLGTYSTAVTYGTGQLYKTVTIDEQSKQVIEYKDREGKVILKKVQLAAVPGTNHTGWLCTYYIYDKFNQLRCVIQPKAVETLALSGFANCSPLGDGGLLAEQCFRYEYDQRNRMIIKKVPGAGEVWMVYDTRDRLVMVQDANLRTQNKWMYTQYDVQDRPIATGLLNSTDTRLTHQAAAYASTAYPNVPGYTYEELTKTFYDDYTWAGAKTYDAADIGKLNAGTNPYAEATVKTELTHGMPTGGKIKVLNTAAQYLITTTYYDAKTRPMQVLADNVNAGTDVTTNQYDFSGKVLSSYLKHTNPASVLTPTVRVLSKMQYDQTGRLLKTWKQLNDNGTDKLIAENSYDELGQLKSKILAPSFGGGAGGGLETLNYDYTIRGWLKGVNKAYANNTSSTNWFGFEMSYEYGFSNSWYNGNISGIKWRSKGDGEQRAFGYDYDAVNRLLKADFTQYTSSSWSTTAGFDFSVSNMSYDANGNILAMNQKGWKIGGSNFIDQLTYTYQANSNKLQLVSDLSNDNASKLGDFKYDAATKTATDYTYDGNGNLAVDNNKKISGIIYNYLNLPQSISVTAKGTIAYTYDAAGNKLKKVTTEGSKITTTTYIGGMVYQNDTLQFISHEEGRIRYKAVGNSFQYDYMLKDHLGNVRMVLTEEQQTDMYPAATLEVATINTEATYYGNLTNTQLAKPSFFSDPLYPTNAKVALVKNTATTQKVGPNILLKVMAGDKYNIRVASGWSSATAATNSNTNVVSSLLSLLSTGAAGASGGKATVPELQNTGSGLNAALTSFANSQTTTGTKPKAYINWILLDEQFKIVTGSSGFEQVGNSGVTTIHTKTNLTADKSGYLYIYTSNDATNVDVFFDNLQVTHVRGPLVSESAYSPFGLTMAGISSKASMFGEPENKKKYNGIEKENDLGLEIYDAQLRELDGQIGRWWEIDPKTENMEMWSPYASNYDNPITYMDPLGDEGQDCCKGFVDAVKSYFGGAGDGAKSTLAGAASRGNGMVNAVTNPSIEGMIRLSPMGFLIGSPSDIVNGVKGSYESGKQVGNELKSGNTNSVAHAAGFLTEKIAEVIIFKTVAGGKGSAKALESNTPKGLSNDAFVVRGGTSKASQFENGSGVKIDAKGNLNNVSVNSANGVSVTELSNTIPNGKIGVTTVGQVRAAGGNVVPAPNLNNPFHSLLKGITPKQAEQLFNPVIHNPSKK